MNDAELFLYPHLLFLYKFFNFNKIFQHDLIYQIRALWHNDYWELLFWYALRL